MNISEPCIRRPIATSLLMAGLLLAGIIAFFFLPIAPLPQIDFPTISVSASLPGADPVTVASSLAAPLERRFAEIAGVSELTSTSTLGGTTITIQFDLNRNIDGAARDVQAAINAAAAQLPSNLPNPPTYRKVNPSDAPIMVLAITSDILPNGEVYNAANSIIGQKLSQINGVSQVIISGAEKSAVRVSVDPMMLASMGISMENVRTILQAANIDSPKGLISGDKNSYILDTNDQLFTADQYRPLIVSQKNGAVVRLGDIGNVRDSVENLLLAGWFNTKRAVLLIIFKQSGANVIETTDRIHEALPLIQHWVQPSIKTVVLADRTTTIRSSVHDVEFVLLLSIVLVVMVVFVFLRRLWATIIPSITVPLALAGTFALMYMLNYSLDNLSLMALAISVGFVVDDAIVVIENIMRFIEQGEKPFDAALKGSKQIGFTIISISTSLIAVFIPILFMGGLVGRLFHEFAVTLSLAIAISALVSLTLTPMMCALFLPAHEPPQKAKEKPSRIRKFFGLVAKLWERGLLLYEDGLKWVLKHQRFMLGVTGLTLVATVYLFAIVPKGFFPEQDTGMLMGTTDASQDISFKLMAEKQQQIVDVLLKDPAIDTVGSFVGNSSGAAVGNNGRLFISLKPLSQRKLSPEQIIARLRPKLEKVEGISLYLVPIQDLRAGGRLSKSQFQYTLQDADFNELKNWSNVLLDKLKQMPELKDVTTDQQTSALQVKVNINRDAANQLGIQPLAIDNALYDAFGQRQVSTMYEDLNQHHVILEAPVLDQKDPKYLNAIYVPTITGSLIPLNTIATFEQTNTPLSINHQGQFPAITISFNLKLGVALGDATKLVQKAVNEIHMPLSVISGFQGTAQVFQSSSSNEPILILAALLAVYIVLGILYESLIHPITILATLPSAGIGALLALLITGNDLSVVSLIGIILLIGIVKKNAIMLVDFALEAERTNNWPPEKAIYEACIVRFRPITMTTVAAILGAIPLAIGLGIGSELRKPLGIAVIGGLLFSQMLTLYITPVIYLFFDRLSERFGKRRKVKLPEKDSLGLPQPAEVEAI